MNKKMSNNETVTISKKTLLDLHAIAAGGGAIMEKSLTRDAVILALAVIGIGKERAVEVLDEASAALGNPVPSVESPEQREVADLLRSIPEGGNREENIDKVLTFAEKKQVV